MKLIIIAALLATPAFATGTVYVQGHTRANGTYVAPHVRTAPDAYKENNFSYKPAQTNSFGTNMGSHAPSYSNSYSR